MKKVYPEINFTITTYKRLCLFEKTMDSFLEACLDKDLINRWILIDDGSSKEDMDKMKNKYPFFEVYQNKYKGQPVSLNKIIEKVDTDWFFHCEDDWCFLEKGNLIKMLFDIAFTDERIKNVILRHKVGNIITGNTITIEGEHSVIYNLHKYDPVREPPLVREYDSRILNEDCNWFGYSWNPGLHHIPTLKLLGKLNENHSDISRKWDRAHALKYLEMGFKRANPIDKIYIKHIGEGLSKYVH